MEASLSGYRKEDIDVQVHDGILSIKTQSSSESEEGAVSRRVALPVIVTDVSVDAELKNGVLTLTIPLHEKAQPKQIEVKGE